MNDVLESIVSSACVELFLTLGVAVRPALGPKSSPRGGSATLPPGAPSSVREPPSAPGSAREPPTSTRFDLSAAGLIEFDDPALSGTLLLVSTFDFVASCRPKELRKQALSSRSSGDWIYVRDWSKELSNQLLGRVKRRISVHGLTFDCRTPVALTGDAVGRAIATRRESPLRFASGPNEVEVWFDTVLTPATEQMMTKRRVQEFAREGDVLLF